MLAGELPLFLIAYVLVLSSLAGFEVVTKVPAVLHTPLMSGSNAISGIILIGAISVTEPLSPTLISALGFVAVILATINVVGGFLVTDRMLQMFRSRPRDNE